MKIENVSGLPIMIEIKKSIVKLIVTSNKPYIAKEPRRMDMSHRYNKDSLLFRM